MKDKLLVDGNGVNWYVNVKHKKNVWPFRIKVYTNWPLLFPFDTFEFKTFAEALAYYIKKDGEQNHFVIERVTQYDVEAEKC